MTTNPTISEDIIHTKIFLIRSKKIMLDRDLAQLYGVETKVLNQAVKRHLDRFPEDFMFRVTEEELLHLKLPPVDSSKSNPASRSQFVTLKRGQNIKYHPYAFTEHGILMLSSVLNSKQAIQVNILIMRTFTQLREMLANHRELREKIEALEAKYNYQFQVVFDAIKKLLEPPTKKSKRSIGFHVK